MDSHFRADHSSGRLPPEYLEEAGISWRVYQDVDNYLCDTLDQFKQFQEQNKWHSPFARKGPGHPGLDQFYEGAKNGSLPEMSYVVGPTDLCAHPPVMPQSGARVHRWMTDTVMNGKHWDSTALFVSYDETGGWADHVMSPHAPKCTPGEWTNNPYEKSMDMQPIGPGFRLPFYIASPFTRNGGVFTEHAAHESQILFLVEWSKTTGRPWESQEINPWRRKHLSNLVNAFDFSNPDQSVPHVTAVKKPIQESATGLLFGGPLPCALARSVVSHGTLQRG